MSALFIALLKALHTDNEKDALYALSELRTDIAFKYVTRGMGLEVDEAIALLQNSEDSNLSQHDKDIIARLKAAILNLIDFSVCEEYQLYKEVLDYDEDSEIDFNSTDYDELLALCKKYNDQYSAIENGDIEYAGMMAALWIKLSAADYIVYWTQNDAKVRPWHMALQGYAAPKDEFPSWMIPPIEYNCRCFLEVLEVPRAKTNLPQIKGSAKNMMPPKQLDGVYSESLATCGRIFSSSHTYFKVLESDKDMLTDFASRLKEKYNV